MPNVEEQLPGGRVHVSELARRLGISRPLLYMNLDRLGKAGLVTGRLELSADGKAMLCAEMTKLAEHANAVEQLMRDVG